MCIANAEEKLRYGISKLRIWGYSIIWGVTLFISTFPQIFDNIKGNSYLESCLDIKELMGEKIIILCIFPMMALMIVHSFDVLYSLNMSSTVDEKFKFGAISTIRFFILTIVALGISIYCVNKDFYIGRVFFFILSWIFIIGLKFVSFKMLKEEGDNNTISITSISIE